RIGIGLIAISGLDALFFLLFLVAKSGNILQFTMLTWNNLQFSILTLLGTLIGYILWVPHHIAALIAGLSAVMLAQSARGKKAFRRFAILTIAGLGFASALGLSVWVTLVFVVLWGIWIVLLFIQKTERGLIIPMVFAGIAAMLLASPFLIGMFQGGGSGGTGQFPIVFEVRAPVLLEPIVKDWSPIARSLVMLAILPFSYLFELGFIFVAGIYWFKIKGKGAIRSNPYYLVELILLAIALFICSCLRSNSALISTNDLGFRAWLPGQFILLVWGVDVAEVLLFNKSGAAPGSVKPREAVIIRNVLQALIVIGILTSTLDAIFLRVFWPAWAGTEFGQQTYSARLAYNYLRDNVPADVITQNNPLTALDRPSGLYGMHQMAISDRTAYGVSSDVFHKSVNEIGVLFTNNNVTDWQLVDHICQGHSIDVLIISDTDPVWSSLTALKKQRPALYENAHYALYPCGDYAQNK
ncbi:MAG: hypothetical protein MUO77_03055, partial [Anaerolineales bacterium]|nr:hypothetical protein [Anaerolineales bacterium]